MSISERVDHIVSDFDQCESWEDRYKKLIQMGKQLPDLPDEKKIEDFRVKGCVSQVWLHARMDDHHRIIFEADSDAMIVKGLVAVLLQIYSGSKPEEVLATPPDFVQKLGFQQNLSPSRANGLASMIKQINYYATAYQALLSRTI